MIFLSIEYFIDKKYSNQISNARKESYSKNTWKGLTGLDLICKQTAVQIFLS